jgi:UTP--glucose-1-phosphate uridylyltransferase
MLTGKESIDVLECNTSYRIGMKEKSIKKAVIPAAGLGTRFLPATKAVPKEMLPLVDIPTIQYIVEEAVHSGIEEILIITNSYKHCMENHFDRSYELEEHLLKANKKSELKMLNDIANMANIYYVRQKEPRGLGHAVLCAQSFIGNEPFAVLLGDDVVVNHGGEPALAQLIEAYNETNASIVGVQTVEKDQVSKYGIISPSKSHEPVGRRVKLTDMVEKPSIEEAPSQMAVLGRYILTPEIFTYLTTQTAGAGGEIQLTDAIKRLMDLQAVYAYDFEGIRYDVGDKFGFIKATIDFALERASLRDQVSAYIKELASKL